MWEIRTWAPLTLLTSSVTLRKSFYFRVFIFSPGQKGKSVSISDHCWSQTFLVCPLGGSLQILCLFWMVSPPLGWTKSGDMKKSFSACNPQTDPSLRCAGVREWFSPASSHLCHLHSQLFCDSGLPAYSLAKQVGLTPASSLLCMRNLIVFDRLLTMEEKTHELD